MPRNLVRFSGVISVFVIILDNILVLSVVKLKTVFGQLEINSAIARKDRKRPSFSPGRVMLSVLVRFTAP